MWTKNEEGNYEFRECGNECHMEIVREGRHGGIRATWIPVDGAPTRSQIFTMPAVTINDLIEKIGEEGDDETLFEARRLWYEIPMAERIAFEIRAVEASNECLTILR